MFNVNMLPLTYRVNMKIIRRLLLKIEASFTVYVLLLPKILNYSINFQYKLIHRILITNSFLYKCELKETDLYTFCTETKENLIYIVWECNYVRNVWLSIGNFLKICGVNLPFNAKDIIIGLTEHSSSQGNINNVLIIFKYYIYVCRCKCRVLDLEGGLEFLKYAILRRHE